MRLCVVGLGYVGTVTAACLAELGHLVDAWDAQPERVRAIQIGHPLITETGLQALLAKGLAKGNLRLPPLSQTTHHDVFFICVGTPLANGHLSHANISEVLSDIYVSSMRQDKTKIAIIRSTINVKTLEQITHELSLKMPNARVEVVLNPEFLREASAVQDFLAPPFIVVGGDDPEGTLEMVLSVYARIPCKKFKVSARCAGALKLACNAFHATKVAFTNEVALACDLLGADAGEVFRIFREDEILNCSDKYLRPGFAYGGSCLPKDLSELVGVLERNGLASPLLQGVRESNDRIIKAACDGIVAKAKDRVAILGITFKPGTGDLRDSPYLRLAGMLLDRGINLQIHDPDLTEGSYAELEACLKGRMGLARLCSGMAEAMAGAEAVALAKLPPDFDDLLASITATGLHVFDLERLLPPPTALGASSAA